jgi:DNA-directed RNA polymerase sigma subunit (sigma70/sigma32)
MARDLKRYKQYQHDRKVKFWADRREGRPMSFAEIGRRLGITGEYASKLYRSAMAKMRRNRD